MSTGIMSVVSRGANGERSRARRREDLRPSSEDVHPAFPGLLEGSRMMPSEMPRILMSIWNAVMPVARSGDLEVHVAQVIFVAEDVAEDRDPVSFLHQAHGDARHRTSSAGAPPSSSASVAAQTVAIDEEPLDSRMSETMPDGVGKFGLGGIMFLIDRSARLPWPISRRPVVPSAPTSPDRERREIVVEHEAFRGIGKQPVDDLLVELRAERQRREALGFAALEERRPVRAREQADLDGDRPDILQPAAVEALSLREDHLAHCRIFHVVEDAR